MNETMIEVNSVALQVDQAKLTKVEQAIAEIETQADAYLCDSPHDFEYGGMLVARVRQTDGILETLYKPVKQIMDAAKKGILDEEKKKRGPLERAKTLIGSKMLAWKTMVDQQARATAKALQDVEQARAQEAALTRAIEMETRAKATDNPALLKEAERVLERPVQMAPITVQSVAPKLTSSGVKTVSRLSLEVTDIAQMLLAVAATELLSRPICDIAVRTALKPYVCRTADGLLDSAANKQKVADLFISLLRDVARMRGDAFAVPGMVAGKREGLG